MTIGLEDIAKFTSSGGMYWLLETKHDKYEWSDPRYGGDNSITQIGGTYDAWLASRNLFRGHSKGEHQVEEFCGKNVVIWWQEPECKCKDCGSSVVATGSTKPMADYVWKCQNPKCEHSLTLTHTGDTEDPSWVEDK